MVTQEKAAILGIPLGFGAEKAGSELGVEAMRSSNFRGQLLADHIRQLGFDLEDRGDVSIQRPVRTPGENENPKYLAEMLPLFETISSEVRSILDDGRLPILLGGDHSIAIGTFAGISLHFKSKHQDVGLIWFDAHADINTPETSPSGNVHGMPLAVLLGDGHPELVGLGGFSPKLNPKYFAHVGGRDFDKGEQSRIHSLRLRDHFFTMSDIDKRGMLACVEDAIAIASKATGGYAVTFDVDVIDPRFAPGSGTLVRGGATYREAHLALEVIADHGGLRSFEIVEVNPLLDQSNITVELAGELVLSAMGKTIL